MLIDAELALCIDLLGDTASSDADAAVSFVVFVGVSISKAAELWHEFNTAKNIQKIIFFTIVVDDDCRRLLLRVFCAAIYRVCVTEEHYILNLAQLTACSKQHSLVKDAQQQSSGVVVIREESHLWPPVVKTDTVRSSSAKEHLQPAASPSKNNSDHCFGIDVIKPLLNHERYNLYGTYRRRAVF